MGDQMEKNDATDRIRELFGGAAAPALAHDEVEVDGVRIRVPVGMTAVLLIGRQREDKEVRRA